MNPNKAVKGRFVGWTAKLLHGFPTGYGGVSLQQSNLRKDQQ